MNNHINKLSSVSFFCPAYNDEGNLPDLISTVSGFLQKRAEKYEIIIIHDGGSDNTGKVADELANKFSFVRVIHHIKNKGYTATLKEGFEIAQYDFVMYTDGDNQYNVYDIEPYLYLLDNHEILAGYATKKAVSKYRRFQSWAHNILINILFFSYNKDINCSLKIFKKLALDQIKINSSARGAFIDAELILKARQLGFAIAQFPVTHYERKSGVASGSNPKIIINTIKDLIRLRTGLL